jgi:hypothetical protein
MRKRPHEPGGWAHALAAAGAAPRCGARRKRTGERCRTPAMPNGRCHKHGGASKGPRTAAGLERCRTAPLKHGGRSAEARQAARDRSEARKVLAALEDLLRGL